ncbi:MAG: sigma-54-dependent transcriptional regulator [Bacillota bacterium]
MNTHRLSLLVVEDERSLARLWASELDHLVEATLSHSIDEARAKLRGRAFDVILLDLHLPDGNGLELMREVTTRGDETAVIILTGNADLNSAIQALRMGAYDYLIKPCRIAELEQHLERISQQQRLRDENRVLRQQIQQDHVELIGSNPALVQVKNLIARVAPTNASVLICGETGTGKEVAARMIHAQSMRRAAPFVPVNCAALPRELAESELFGHRKGAFTGADRDHRGLVLAATGGTLFLDEIGDLPLEMQAKFLRLLESNEARRVGDTEAYRTDVRIIAATNRDLRKDVAANRFRQDLFYRLATFELNLPCLRQISDDLPAIAEHLLHITTVPRAAAQHFSPAALTAMQQYPWPGNVRELRNVIERAKILCDQAEVMPEHLNLPLAPMAEESGMVEAAEGSKGTIAEVEWQMIQEALRKHDGNKTAAAKSLGISLRTLYNKLQARSSPQLQQPMP